MGDQFENAGRGMGFVLAAAVAGAAIGGSLSAAKNFQKVKKEEMSREEAMHALLKEAGTCGFATAVGSAAVGLVGLRGAFALIGFIPVTIGAKYLADKALDKRAQTVDVKDTSPEEETP